MAVILLFMRKEKNFYIVQKLKFSLKIHQYRVLNWSQIIKRNERSFDKYTSPNMNLEDKMQLGDENLKQMDLKDPDG